MKRYATLSVPKPRLAADEEAHMTMPRFIGLVFALTAGCGLRSHAAEAVTSGGSDVVAARVLHVSMRGDDTAEGSEIAPLRHIQTAIDRARAGDIVQVMAGVYRERLSITHGGERGQALRVIGDDGAILDGSNDFTPQWKPAPDIGPGVFLTTIPFEPRCVTVDGRFFTLLDQDRVTEANGAWPAWVWKRVLADGVNSRGESATWKGINGLGVYFTEGDRFYVRLKNQQDPAGVHFVFAPQEPAISVDGADHVVIRNLSIRDTPLGIRIRQASHIVVEDCVIGPSREGVGLGAGSRNCSVRYCEVFQNPYSDYLPHPNSWETWTAHKRGGFYDMRGIKIEQSDGGHDIHDNWIHNHWDGISSMGWSHWQSTAQERLGWAHYNQNLDIHHNRIEDMNDDALEPNSAEVNNRWHDNVVLRSRCGLRVKVVDVGPLYLYRNLFADNNEDIRFFGQLELNPAEVYIYHNTSTSAAAITSNKVRGIGTPNYHVYNNLFYARRWWKNTDGSVEPNWHADHNVYVRQVDAPVWDNMRAMAEALPMDTNSRWVESGQLPFVSLQPLDLALTEGSPARGAGANLNAMFGGKLPGLEGKAYETDYPDAGAVPWGTSMPQIPRPQP